jgi:hypothetical protein
MALSLSFATGFAKPDAFGDCPGCSEPQSEEELTYSTVMRQTDDGTLQLIFFLDLNKNGELDAGEPIAQVVTIAK